MTTLNDPIQIGTLSLKNRLYRAPVLEGAGDSKSPSDTYAKHFVPNAEAGLGLIVQGNTIVLPEGRTSPGMSAIDEKQDMLALAPMVRAVHAAGGKIVTQLGHGGAFALESWHRQYATTRKRPPMAPSPLPVWLRPSQGRVHVPDTAEVEALCRRFGVVASWAREAGYDGVQLAGGNVKLLHQFMSPTYNKRHDRFGGSLKGRMQLIVEIRRCIAEEAGADFPVLLKMPGFEAGLVGTAIDLATGVEMARIAEQAGFAALTPVATHSLPNTAICRGDFPTNAFEDGPVRRRLLEATGSRPRLYVVAAGMWLAARSFPFEPDWNREVYAAVKPAVSIPVFAVGGIRTPKQATDILASGDADLIGVGRPFYAEPALAARFLAESAAASEQATTCENCNRCIVPQMLGLAGVCYNPSVNRASKAADRGRATLAQRSGPAAETQRVLQT